MARNRQRAKDRKQKLHRENIPGSLDHASGEVEEVEAAIVAGAGGKPVEPAPDDVADEPVDAVEPDDAVEPMRSSLTSRSRSRRSRPPSRPSAGATASVPPLTSPSPPTSPRRPASPSSSPMTTTPRSTLTTRRTLDADAASVEHDRLGKGAGDLAVTPDAHKPAGFRLANFIRACWAELQRVDWPDRRQVGQATAVVLGFVVVAGAFLGLADVVAQRIVDFIL